MFDNVFVYYKMHISGKLKIQSQQKQKNPDTRFYVAKANLF